jgi:Fe-S-cluster containining protein
MNITLIKAILKAKRKGLLRLVPASEATRLDCLADKCAKCCRTLGTPVTTPQEAEKIGFDSIAKDRTGMFIKSNKCVCSLLKKNLCSIYLVRPRGCREYPWYNVDNRLYYDSGCPGIKHDIDERPNADSIQPFENFFPLTSGAILWFVKKICVSGA